MHVPAWPVLPDSTLAPQAVLEKFRVRSLAGLGVLQCLDPNDSSSCYEDGTGQGGTPTPPAGGGVDLCSLYPTPGCPGAPLPTPISQLPVTTVGSQTGYVMPSQSSAQWANAIAALEKTGMSLAQLSMIQPGTVVSANGAILRQATGLPVPVTTSTTNLGLTGSASSGLLVAAVVGLAFVMMMSRGRG